MNKETIKYFRVKDPKFARLYLLLKIHKRLNNVPGRSVISNYGYYTENISAFLDFHLQPLAQAVKSYINDTNDSLNKLRSLPKLLGNIILCMVDVFGLYPNIPYEKGLPALMKRLNKRMEKCISSDILCDLAEVVLKNNSFKFGEKTLNQKEGLQVEQNLRLVIVFCLWQNWKRKFLEKQNLNRICGGGILTIYLSFGSMDKKN